MGKYKCTINSVDSSMMNVASTKPQKIKAATPWVHKLNHEKQDKMPKNSKISSTYHMKAKVNHNGKKSGAELKIKSEHKQEHGHKKRRLGIMDEDEDEYIDIEDIRLNEDDDDVSSKLAD